MSIAVTRAAWECSLPIDSTAKFVLVRLADFADDRGGNIYPSLARVANDCGLTDRAVRSAVRRLEAAGVLTVEQKEDPGRHRPRLYRIDLHALREGNSDASGGTTFRAECGSGRNVVPEQAERRSGAGGTTFRQSIIDPSCNHQESLSVAEQSEDDADHPHQIHQPDNQQHRGDQPNAKARKTDQGAEEFEGWWTLYPRKIGKGAARTAYARARRKASAEELEAAARRFAALVTAERRDLRYVPHPTTWLNQERWADVPAGPTQAHDGPTISRGTRAAMEAFGRAAQRHAEEVDQ